MSRGKIRSDDPTPIRSQLRVLLEREIRDGRFCPGSRIPSERTLAERYGISRSSVRESITELISEGVLFRTVGKGTFVSERSEHASRRKSATHNIAFVINERIFQFVQTGYSRILTGVDRACRENGYRLLFNAAGEWPQSSFLERLARNGVPYVDACIITGGIQQNLLEHLKEMKIPLVLVDMLVTEDSDDLSTVRIDYANGTLEAVKNLHALGHRRIGFIGFPASQKYEAYWRALETLSLPYDPRRVLFLPLLNLQPGILAGYTAMQDLIRSQNIPSALVVTNDLVAVGVIEALGVSGIPVPEQISIIGYDDLVEKTSPPLTTVHVDFLRVGKAATEVVLKALAGENVAPVDVVVPVDLVVRGSTAPPQDAEG